jgi:hypothetical protein
MDVTSIEHEQTLNSLSRKSYRLLIVVRPPMEEISNVIPDRGLAHVGT